MLELLETQCFYSLRHINKLSVRSSGIAESLKHRITPKRTQQSKQTMSYFFDTKIKLVIVDRVYYIYILYIDGVRKTEKIQMTM